MMIFHRTSSFESAANCSPTEVFETIAIVRLRDGEAMVVLAPKGEGKTVGDLTAGLATTPPDGRSDDAVALLAAIGMSEAA